MKIITLRGGKRYLIGGGGHRNRDTIPGGKVEVFGQLRKVDEVSVEDTPSQYGYGVTKHEILKDDKGYIVVTKYEWYPSLGYSWSEGWETVQRATKEEVDAILDIEVIKEEEL